MQLVGGVGANVTETGTVEVRLDLATARTAPG